MNEKLSHPNLTKHKVRSVVLRFLLLLTCLSCAALSFSGCVLPGQPTPGLPPPIQDLVGTSIVKTLAA